MGKRLFDIAGAILGLIILALPMVLLALLVRWQMGSPILFRQLRPGRGGVPFEIIKFRTMRDAFAADGQPLEDAQRLTRLGRFLRSTSLDELPELWNVLVGDMSLVGPRPLLLEYLPLYSARQQRRHEVRPGLTGWAQIHGRNALTWQEKFDHDLWYVDNRSFCLDLKILGLTFLTVFRRDGISSPGEATMPRFTGDPD